MQEQLPKRIAINGFGRIGRCVLRAWLESPEYRQQFTVVAINELADHKTLAHLLKYDSTHGRLDAEVSLNGSQLQIQSAGECFTIALSSTADVAEQNWQGVDILLECSGSFSDRGTAEKHLQQGAKKVLFSQPGEAGVDATVVYGVNQHILQPQHTIVSCASCTTNAITPVLKIIDQAFGIEAGTITTLHSAMNDQPVIDAYHNTDLRKTRAAISSMIPVNTELAKGIERILPAMAGKFIAHAIRVPTINVSALDVSLQLRTSCSAEEINRVLADNAASVNGVLSVTYEPLASCDFNHDPHSVIVDAGLTQVVQGHLVKLLLWFDNEWAYANRMLDVAALL